jgi:NAD-dependent SIR2 family protein deacetylase
MGLAQKMIKESIQRAVDVIRNADAVFIGNGAGMGVGSGLGTYRGINAATWPPLARRAMVFHQMSSPGWFSQKPNFAWAFWHWRYTLYTELPPHQGYTILKEICEKKKYGGFSFTTNIDGHWIASGFPEDRIVEIHGSVRYMQCNQQCNATIWPVKPQEITKLVVQSDDHVNDPLPTCINCGGIARPNVLMYSDFDWLSERCESQKKKSKPMVSLN